MVKFLDHEYGFSVQVFLTLSTKNGPFSYAKASIEEHPGPPLNQKTTGSLTGSFSDLTIR